jgi:hypothetical protein
MPHSTPIQLELTRSEAIVLEDFLARFEQHPSFREFDAAEQRALYNLHARLEQTIDELLDPDYQHILSQACAELRGEEG